MNQHRATNQPNALPLVGSVVIPAHNEAGVIGRCLDALFHGFAHGELDVVVACNGCRDDTAQLARASGHPVRVIDLEVASKAAALRAGDAAAMTFPRLYLDADVVLDGGAARSVFDHLKAGALAARPPISYDSSRSSATVRSYYRARAQVPAVLRSLWGAGVYGLSEAGPPVRRVSGRRRRRPVARSPVRRGRGGDRGLRAGGGHGAAAPARPPPCASPHVQGQAKSTAPESGLDERAKNITTGTLGDLRRHASRGPRAALDAATYAAFAATARLALRLASPQAATPGALGWERDESSRTA